MDRKSTTEAAEAQRNQLMIMRSGDLFGSRDATWMGGNQIHRADAEKTRAIAADECRKRR